MEQLEEDVRRPMQQHNTTRKDPQEDCSASYAVRSRKQCRPADDQRPREETGSDGNDDV